MDLAFGDERRSSPRVPFLGQAVVRAAGRHVPCTTVNLSATGMMLLPAASARPGLSMRVVFKVDHDLGAVELPAVLAREGEHQGTYSWGVRFINVPQRLSSMLQVYVQQRVLAEREHTPTPPLGIESDPTGRGQYLQVKRRGVVRDMVDPAGGYSGHERAPRTGRTAGTTTPGPAQAASRGASSPGISGSGIYRQTAVGWRERVQARRSSATAGQSQTGHAYARRVDAVAAPEDRETPSVAARGAPSLAGLSVPTGQGPLEPIRQRLLRQPGGTTQPSVGRYAHAGERRSSAENTASQQQTGSAGWRAVEATGQTGPQRPVQQTGPHRSVQARTTPGAGNKPARRSSPTPLEVRELYQAALDELDGKHGKKKRRSSVPEEQKRSSLLDALQDPKKKV